MKPAKRGITEVQEKNCFLSKRECHNGDSDTLSKPSFATINMMGLKEKKKRMN